MTNAENLGKKLYELRKKSGLSQEEFADKLNVSRQAVSKWERGETLPDTENLITIAKLYGVSLDELIDNGVKPENDKQEEVKSENANQDNDANNQDVKVQISTDGIRVNVDDGNEKVEIDLDADGLNIDVKNPLDEIDEDEIFFTPDGNPKSGKHNIFTRILFALPYPVLVTIGFLLWGFLAPNGFSVSWTLFITIPVYYSVIDCIKKKRFSEFCYPVFLVAIYCFIGMQWNLWHPYWIIFITIPIYYCIAEAIDKR